MGEVSYIQGIPDQTRMARECALLGNYDTAVTYFDGVIASIHKYVSTCDDSYERDRWNKMKESLQAEAKVVKDLSRTLLGYRGASKGRPSTPAGGGGGGIPDLRGGGGGGRGGRADEPVVRRPWEPPTGGDPDVWPPPTPLPPSKDRKPSRAVAPSWGPSSQSSADRKRAQPKRGSQAPARAKRESAPAGRGRGAGPAGRGKAKKKNSGEKPKYSEVMESSPDAQLIATIESEILDANPNVEFSSIAGLDEAKDLLQEAVVLPTIIPGYFQGIRRPWKGILMFGPPGTGKTLLAKAVATECKTTFFNVTAASLASKWRGESEKMVRILFQMARYYAPSTIFFDEIDALASARGEGDHEASRRVKTELLVQMDGISSVVTPGEDKKENNGNVIVIAASNLPWTLDEAFRRRLEKRIYIPLPEPEGRAALFRIAMDSVPLDESVNFVKLASATDGYSGADITNICRDAAMVAMRRFVKEHRAKGGKIEDIRKVLSKADDDISAIPVSMEHFTESLAKIQPSVGTSDLVKFDKWKEEFGSG